MAAGLPEIKELYAVTKPCTIVEATAVWKPLLFNFLHLAGDAAGVGSGPEQVTGKNQVTTGVVHNSETLHKTVHRKHYTKPYTVHILFINCSTMCINFLDCQYLFFDMYKIFH